MTRTELAIKLASHIPRMRHGWTLNEFAVALLLSDGPRTVAEISHAFSWGVATASDSVASLYGKGCVERVETVDRRHHLVELTPKGLRRLKESRASL